MPCPADSWRTQPVSRLRLLGLELGFGHYSARAMASARITNGGKRDDEGDDAGKDWKVVIADEYARRSGVYAAPDETSFPLIASSIFSEEILAAVDSMLNGQLTMANNVREFERAFATYVGAPFAVMCNSGSSANLLGLLARSRTICDQRNSASATKC